VTNDEAGGGVPRPDVVLGKPITGGFTFFSPLPWGEGGDPALAGEPGEGFRTGRHTTPHLRRSSHSEDRNNKINRKIAGMFHKSLVSRVVIPASE